MSSEKSLFRDMVSLKMEKPGSYWKPTLPLYHMRLAQNFSDIMPPKLMEELKFKGS